MVVLVTGAAGFIGSHVTKILLSQGHDVRATARNSTSAEFLKEFASDSAGSFEIVEMNLLDAQSVKAAVCGCNIIIHCAATLPVGAKNAQRDIVDPSVIGVQNLCSAIDECQDVETIIHTSSVAAIRNKRAGQGHMYNREEWCDDADLKTNPYGLAKASAERHIRDWWNSKAENEKPRLVTIHPSVVWGPILHERHAQGSMAYLKHFVSGPPFVLKMHIEAVDVRDVAQAHVNAISKGENGVRHIIHSSGIWMEEVGVLLNGRMPEKKWATRQLAKPLAMMLATMHPKLNRRDLARSWGRWCSFDTQDSEQQLGIELRDLEQTILDGINSLISAEL